MSVEMEKRARVIFRDTLLKHYIDELPCGDEVELWLKTHGGWFPDNQVSYGDGTPLTQPKDEGTDVVSPEPEKALREASTLMELIWPVLDDYDADLMSSMCDWLTSLWPQQASAPSQLTEANVEANDFCLEFAKETLQSFKNKRDRSRSPLRVGPLPNAARAALDVVCRHDTEARVEDQRATIAQPRQELAAKDVEIADLRVGKGAIGPILASYELR